MIIIHFNDINNISPIPRDVHRQAKEIMQVTIELTSYPSTGYLWEPETEADNCVPFTDYDEDGTYGGPLTTRFVYDDVAPETELVFFYRRPWQAAEPEANSVRVKVE